MTTTIGSVNNSGNPTIRITIAGTFPNSAQEFEAMVDTGFTGFVSMPIMSALPLGLPLYGTTSVQFGDGSSAARYTALCSVTLGDETEAGVAILEPTTTQVLVGMEFLARFKKSIIMHRQVLFLVDESEADKAFKAAADEQTATQQDNTKAGEPVQKAEPPTNPPKNSK